MYFWEGLLGGSGSQTGIADFLILPCPVLEAPRYNGVYVPPGCALGYQTLMEETTLYYQMSAFYIPEWSAGFRWNDPRFGIAWPEMPEVINERDATYPDFDASVVEEFRGYP